jgi:NAD(P)-dependent dehydrogenase (short-subunit alcohol dehydrogenase family)
MYMDMINVNQHRVYHTCKAAAPYLIEQNTGGSMILISSTAGRKGFANRRNAARRRRLPREALEGPDPRDQAGVTRRLAI